MSFDRDGIDERLDLESVRESLAERVDVAAARERLDGARDPAALRAGLDDLYARYFMPPSVTEDVDEAAVEAALDGAADTDVEPFDFQAWLRAGRASGPQKPPLEPRVVTDAAETAAPPDRVEVAYGSFDFEGWLADGEEFEPVAVLEPDEPAVDGPAEPPSADAPLLPRPSVGLHPVKAATFALFLSVVALVGLTVVGYLPALGPATGFGP